MEERELRVGVAGTRIVGAVYARSARLAGDTPADVADLSPERAEVAARRLGPDDRHATTDHWVDAPAREPMEFAP
jgi:predicted dehydrogenase